MNATLLRLFELHVRNHEEAKVRMIDPRPLEKAVETAREAFLKGDLPEQGAAYWKARALAAEERAAALQGELDDVARDSYPDPERN